MSASSPGFSAYPAWYTPPRSHIAPLVYSRFRQARGDVRRAHENNSHFLSPRLDFVIVRFRHHLFQLLRREHAFGDLRVQVPVQMVDLVAEAAWRSAPRPRISNQSPFRSCARTVTYVGPRDHAVLPRHDSGSPPRRSAALRFGTRSRDSPAPAISSPTSTTTSRRSTPTCGAASPTPLAFRSRLLHIVDAAAPDGRQICHRAAFLVRAGSPTVTIFRSAICIFPLNHKPIYISKGAHAPVFWVFCELPQHNTPACCRTRLGIFAAQAEAVAVHAVHLRHRRGRRTEQLQQLRQRHRSETAPRSPAAASPRCGCSRSSCRHVTVTVDTSRKRRTAPQRAQLDLHVVKRVVVLPRRQRACTGCSGVIVWMSAVPALLPRPARPTTCVTSENVVSAARKLPKYSDRSASKTPTSVTFSKSSPLATICVPSKNRNLFVAQSAIGSPRGRSTALDGVGVHTQNAARPAAAPCSSCSTLCVPKPTLLQRPAA